MARHALPRRKVRLGHIASVGKQFIRRIWLANFYIVDFLFFVHIQKRAPVMPVRDIAMVIFLTVFMFSFFLKLNQCGQRHLTSCANLA